MKMGDVVIAMDRPWIKEGFKVAQVSESDLPSVLVQRVARLRGSAIVPNSFLFELVRRPAFTKHCRPTETTIPHISPNDIRSFRFRLPPKDLLASFDRVVMSLRNTADHQRAALEKLNLLSISLQHRAFRGEL